MNYPSKENEEVVFEYKLFKAIKLFDNPGMETYIYGPDKSLLEDGEEITEILAENPVICYEHEAKTYEELFPVLSEFGQITLNIYDVDAKTGGTRLMFDNFKDHPLVLYAKDAEDPNPVVTFEFKGKPVLDLESKPLKAYIRKHAPEFEGVKYKRLDKLIDAILLRHARKNCDCCPTCGAPP